jgi:hypothetical protein
MSGDHELLVRWNDVKRDLALRMRYQRLAGGIGMTDIICFTAAAAAPTATRTSTFSRTNSPAISAKRSVRPSAQRYSIATLPPSIHPSSRSRCANAAVHWLCAEGVFAPKNPIVGSPNWLMRERNEWPRRRAAEQRHELTSSYIRTQTQGPALYRLKRAL